ncbi:tRNA dihydrouridine synthase [Persicirhabdus sediminis]|nr:tRNA-dihydrouridine synthase family protein [Persicirhabdus sediminis]
MFAFSQPYLALAPMQAITDLPFMRVMQQFGGPDYFVTEYFRVHEHYHLEKKILASIVDNDTGRPVFAQMIGQDIDALVRNAKDLMNYPVAGVDLNLGCPAPVVCRKDAGGGLLRTPARVDEILGRLRDAIDGKFTVKTRIGYTSHDEFEQLLEIFNRHELDLLTIHGRTVLERYQTPVHDDCVRRAVEVMDCPVIANGNVVDVTTARGYLQKTGAAGLMIGRGAIRSPWVFEQIRQDLAGQPIKQVKRSDLLEYIQLLYDAIAADPFIDFDPNKHVQRMKKYLSYMAQGVDEEFEFQIRRAKQPAEFFAICERHLANDQLVPQLPPENSKLFCGFNELAEQ